MSLFNLSILLSLICLLHITGTTDSSVVPSSNFIKSSCGITRYPKLCVHSLSLHAKRIQQSPQELAATALELSLNRTISAQTFMKKLIKFKGLTSKQQAAIKDCLEEVEDSLDRVGKSVQEMKRMNRAKGSQFIWHMSNVKTWVSAALTDETTCSDGFADRDMDGKIKSSVRAQVSGVAQVTSIALALVNDFADKHEQ